MRMWLLWARLKNRNTDVAGDGTSSRATSGNGNLGRLRARITVGPFHAQLPFFPPPPAGRGHGVFCNLLIIRYHFYRGVETQLFFGHVSTPGFITH